MIIDENGTSAFAKGIDILLGDMPVFYEVIGFQYFVDRTEFIMLNIKQPITVFFQRLVIGGKDTTKKRE